MNYAAINGYTELTKFKDVREFNNHFEQAMIDAKAVFTKSEYIALNRLRKFAADVTGVAWCKLQTAVASTHTSELTGVSRSTFERMLRKARAINLITVIPQRRANNYRKHNVYIFNRVDELRLIDGIVSNLRTIDVPESATIDGTITNNLFKLSESKQVNNIKSVAVKVLSEGSKERAPMTREHLAVYARNTYQTALYDFISAMPYPSDVLSVVDVLALRIGDDCTEERYYTAKRVIHSIAMQIHAGYAFTNVVATFSAAIEARANYPQIIAKETQKRPRKVMPFYNWLESEGNV